jgi:hypothetical protein
MIIALYLHFLNILHIHQLITIKIVYFILFIPVIFLEVKFSRYFDRSKILWALILRILFWFILFLIWDIYIPIVSLSAQWLKWFAPEIYLCFALILWAEGWIALIAIFVWFCLHYLLTIKKRKFRLTTSIIFPIIIILVLFVHLYFYGGRGGININDITKQDGVKIFFDIKNNELKDILKSHPRFIYYSKKSGSLIITYGCTFCEDHEMYPTVIKKNLFEKGGVIFTSSNIRKICVDESSNSIFVAPWYIEKFYELSIDDLSIKREYRNHAGFVIEFWQPMVILKDVTLPKVYVANDAEQAILTYDLNNGTIQNVLHLNKEGYVKPGGPVWNLIQSKKTRKLYFTSGPGENLFEVDPDELKVLKHKKFFDVTGTALVLDDENDLLYYQNGWFDTIYEIDIKTFQVKRKLKGEGHARCMILDKSRNCLYVLGYFSGTVFSVDLGTGKKLWKRRVGGSPHGMALNNNTLWVNSMRGVIQLDLLKLWEKEGES